MSSVVPPASPPRRKPWEEANPWISGILAFLLPGAGHFYQGRLFKGLIYFVCIHGAFFTGMCLGEGMTVHHKVVSNAKGWQRISLSYAAQFGSGVWAMPALVQARRVVDKENQKAFVLQAQLTSSFRGNLEAQGPGSQDWEGTLVGTISLEPVQGPTVRDVEGTFHGTLNGKPVDLELSGGFSLDKPIGASSGRALQIRGKRPANASPNLDLVILGTIPRPLWNWYEVPPETAELQEITGRLGKYFELALVFTWIAGLLNVLAIWDCVKGPSLGFGDEKPDEASSGSSAPAPAAGK